MRSVSAIRTGFSWWGEVTKENLTFSSRLRCSARFSKLRNAKSRIRNCRRTYTVGARVRATRGNSNTAARERETICRIAIALRLGNRKPMIAICARERSTRRAATRLRAACIVVARRRVSALGSRWYYLASLVIIASRRRYETSVNQRHRKSSETESRLIGCCLISGSDRNYQKAPKTTKYRSSQF